MLKLSIRRLFSQSINQSSRTMTNDVFVYGTLKIGEPNNYRMTDVDSGVQEFISHATTVNAFPLIIATRFNVPFLLDREGMGKTVEGDIYKVDDKKLAMLDEMEGHPDRYHRRVEKVKLTNGEIMDCWIYLLPKFRSDFLELPFETSYSSTEDRPLAAVTPEIREKYPEEIKAMFASFQQYLKGDIDEMADLIDFKKGVKY